MLNKRNVPAHVERDEVVAVAREALVKACKTFDPSYGVPPRSWISMRVFGAVIDALRCGGPRTRRELELGLDRAYRPDVVSLSAPAGRAGCSDTIAELLPGEGPDLVARARQAEVRRALGRLGKRQRRILFRSFFEGCSAGEIARLEGISESRVHVLRRDALANLRRMLGHSDDEGGDNLNPLSEMELEVLRGTALGESAGETAGRLSRSIETIKDHRRRIIQKLQARNMYHALTIGFQSGLLEPSSLRRAAPSAPARTARRGG